MQKSPAANTAAPAVDSAGAGPSNAAAGAGNPADLARVLAAALQAVAGVSNTARTNMHLSDCEMLLCLATDAFNAVPGVTACAFHMWRAVWFR